MPPVNNQGLVLTKIRDQRDESEQPCEVEWSTDGGHSSVEVRAPSREKLQGWSERDMEEALLALWERLDEAGVVLGIARFRKNAIVSGLSRGMSGGMRCYLARYGWPVAQWHMTDCLAATKCSTVGTQEDNANFQRRYRRTMIMLPLTGPVTLLRSRWRERFGEK